MITLINVIRKISLALFVFKVFLFTSNAQNIVIADYTVYYDFKCISDTTANTFFKPQEFMLLGLSEESKFMTSGRYHYDSVVMAFEKEHPQPDFKSQDEVQNYLDLYRKKGNSMSVGFDYRIIKNFKTDHFISIITFLTVPMQYMEEPMNFDWDITNELDTILGLPCMKATTQYGGRHYEAWFTLEVPINDGPYVFRGLPGLLLKVNDNQDWYTFTATNIITEKTTKCISGDWLNKYSQKINRKTFVDKMIKHKHTPQMPAEVLNFSEEARLRLKNAYVNRFDLLLDQY